ncbi:hypothetical protein [Streptomyces platensis]|uniref:hypothetical protein n=1 Tax=Streptomyces platensis TaxID=58346 RepID=UPI00379FFDDF
MRQPPAAGRASPGCDAPPSTADSEYAQRGKTVEIIGRCDLVLSSAVQDAIRRCGRAGRNPPIPPAPPAPVCSAVGVVVGDRSCHCGRVGRRAITMGSVASPWTARWQDSRGGIPAHGNQRTTWDEGCRHDYENPEDRWPGRAEPPILRTM